MTSTLNLKGKSNWTLLLHHDPVNHYAEDDANLEIFFWLEENTSAEIEEEEFNSDKGGFIDNSYNYLVHQDKYLALHVL